MRNYLYRLATIVAVVGTLLLTSCGIYEYSLYDRSGGATKIGCVDFYTNTNDAGWRDYDPTNLYRYDGRGGTESLGVLNGTARKRVRVVVPVGRHMFKYGVFPTFEDVTVEVPENMVVPVEATGYTPAGLKYLSPLAAMITQKNESKVGAPHSWNPNDYPWVEMK